MGKYGIGARVRDRAGDEGTIIGKRKGERQIRYDNPIYCQDGWFDKSTFTPIDPAPTSQEPWAPKVGDRVRLLRDNCGRKDWGAVGESGTVVSVNEPNTDAWIEFDKSGRWHAQFQDLEPLPAAEQPAGQEASDKPAAEPAFVPFKTGDRVRCDDNRGAPLNFVTGNFYTVKSVEGSKRDSLVWVKETDASMCAYRFSPAPLTIVAGRYYRTRDGRKVGPMVEEDHWSDGYPFTAVGCDDYFDANGKAQWLHDDLLAEWVEPAAVTVPEPAAPPAKFKVGDRVRGNAGFSFDPTEGVISSVNDGYCGVKVPSHEDPDYEWNYPFDKLTLLPTPPVNFIVARLTPTGQPRPSARPRVHTTLASAQAEAKRLANRLGDDFAVYQRVATESVDAGPVPVTDGWPFDVELAKRWFADGHWSGANAFYWTATQQGYDFWLAQMDHITPLGRAILRKWIAEVEANATTKEAA